MSQFFSLRYPVAIVFLIFVATIIGFSTTPPAIFAHLAGIAVGLLSFLVLKWTIDLVNSEKPTEKSARAATAFIISAFLIKIPLLGLIGFFVWQLPVPGPGCFGLGVVSVYSAAIGLVVTRNKLH